MTRPTAICSTVPALRIVFLLASVCLRVCVCVCERACACLLVCFFKELHRKEMESIKVTVHFQIFLLNNNINGSARLF